MIESKHRSEEVVTPANPTVTRPRVFACARKGEV
jgi:hypothetical protein